MKQKRKNKKRVKRPLGLTPEQELFCYYYADHESTRFNGTEAYLAAYDKEGTMDRKVAQMSGSRLLLNVVVNDKINRLIDASINDETVDHELQKVIRQDDERPVKVQAIREYNKLKGRITEHHEIEATASLSELLKAAKPD